MSALLRVYLSSFDVAQDDPELVEGSKDEPFCSWFDKLTTSEVSKRFGRTTIAAVLRRAS